MSGSSKTEKTIQRLDAAQLDTRYCKPHYSKIGYDAEEKIFWTTIDRINFKTAYEVIVQVLAAHQYVINFENILACLDKSGFGIRAQLEQSNANIKQYNHVFYFRLPMKNSYSDMMNMFYKEISIYEQAILLKRKEEPQKKEVLEVEHLIKENQQLKLKLAEQISKKKKSEWAYSYSESEHFNESYKLGTVQAIRFNERQITIKMEQKIFHFPFSKMTRLPEQNQNCLVYYQDGVAKDVWFVEAKKEIDSLTAIVLYKKDQLIKLRDIKRRTFIVHAITQDERDLWTKLQRGSLVQIGTFERNFISIKPMRLETVTRWSDQVQEAIAIRQIEQYQQQVAILQQRKKAVA